MNTRQAIQPYSTPTVLSVSVNVSRKRFITGLSSGLRCFRVDNCLTTYDPTSSDPDSPFVDGIAIAEALDDRYIAYAYGGRNSPRKGSVVIFWDCVLAKEVQRFDLGEPVKGVRLCGRWMVVVLAERAVVFAYQELMQGPTPPPDDEDDELYMSTGNVERKDGDLKGPNKVHALHQTTTNTFALACLRNDLLVLPAKSVGQVQLVPLPSGSKRVMRAHNTAIRCIALSPSGNLLATASEQGTLIRVFDTRNLDQTAEFRRGVEKSIVYSLAFSDGERWLACTSDKGTVHVFDLRPSPPEDPLVSAPTLRTASAAQQHRKTLSHPPAATHAPPSLSNLSSPTTTNTATYQGSIQEYYGLRPPPINPSSSPAVASAISSFKQLSWAPKVLKDVRSIASSPFHMGDEPVYWQGGTSHTWTTAPDGTRKRVKNAVPALPGDPAGKPVKGRLMFALAEGREDDDGAVFYVVGGGTDARWEMFDLLPKEGGGWALVKRGWRRYLTKQFVE